MPYLDTDLLPPIFDQVVTYFGDGLPGAEVRADIVDALFAAIVHAAAENVREKRRELGLNSKANEYPELETSDRLSGANLSRAQLVEKMQATVPLSSAILETALLLIECQIDLRLGPDRGFKIRGIEFQLGIQTEVHHVAEWCRTILPATLQGVSGDRPSRLPNLFRRRPEGIRVLVEGLQLSATMRRAVPYKIQVENHLIDPLMQDRDSDLRIRVLHISDLHLVEEITEEGRKKKWPIGVATHALNTARTLGRTVYDLKPKYDLVLATGDLTTDGAKGSFETVKQYVQSGSLSGENPMRIATFGLHIGEGNRLLLPGNHDRYGGSVVPGQKATAVFEEVLKTPTLYPYVVGYRPRAQDRDSLTLLFFVFDSNLQVAPRPADFRGHVESISRGEVTKVEIQAFQRLATEVAEKRVVKDLYGQDLSFDPRKTVRIAVLHHHPIGPPEAEAEVQQGGTSFISVLKHPFKAIRRSWGSYEEFLMAMEGADEFLSGCFSAGVSLILFGHQHVPYYRLVTRPKDLSTSTPFGAAPAEIHCFCCPSTLEHKASNNGFYIFDFFDENKVAVDLYLSQRSPNGVSGEFTRVAEKSRVMDISSPEVNPPPDAGE